MSLDLKKFSTGLYGANPENAKRMADRIAELEAEIDSLRSALSEQPMADALHKARASLARVTEERDKSDSLALKYAAQRDEAVRLANDEAWAREERNRLRDLLATVHRDGGHRAEEVGFNKAVTEAIEEWARLMTAADEAREQRDALGEWVLEAIREQRVDPILGRCEETAMRLLAERDARVEAAALEAAAQEAERGYPPTLSADEIRVFRALRMRRALANGKGG